MADELDIFEEGTEKKKKSPKSQHLERALDFKLESRAFFVARGILSDVPHYQSSKT